MAINIQIAEPSANLKPFIRYYKYIESDVTGILKAVPITNLELYFNYSHVNIYSQGYYDIDYPKVFLVGLQSYDQVGFTHMYGTDRGGGFVIVFQPQGINHLFGICSADFSKYALEGDSIFKKDIYCLYDRLKEFYNVNDMKILVEKYFSKYAKYAYSKSNLINDISCYIEKSHGMIRVSQLCEVFHITPRSLQRKFKDEIGVSPMDHLHIYRINRAIRMLTSNPCADLTEISYRSGYYDQAHFTKDIKKIIDITPGQVQGSNKMKDSTHHDRLFLRVDKN